jgi:ketosteroid isomerase-like protein
VRRVIYTGGVLAALAVGFVTGSWAARDEREELLQVDREFDEATARGGAEAWTSYFAPDGIMMSGGEPMAVGRAAVREAAERRFSGKNFVLRWEPVGAEVSGRLGYTYGLSRSRQVGPNGEIVEGYGKYLTVWKKQRNGAWQVVADCGNSNPPPAAKPAQ